MGEGEASRPPSPDDILRPHNFPSYVGAAWRLFRLAQKPLLRSFFVMAVALAGLSVVLALAADSAGSDSLLLIVGYAQLLLLPFLASLLAARTALIMARKLAGEDLSFGDAGAELREVRSHLIAGGMIAAFLALALAQILVGFLDVMSASVAFHLVLGPPVLAQVIALEKTSLQDGWARVKERSRGQGLRLFLYLFCVALLLVMVEFMVGLTAISLVARGWSEDAAGIANLLLAVVMAGVGLSFMSAMGLVAYFDMRSRNDDEFEVEDLKSEPEDS